MTQGKVVNAIMLAAWLGVTATGVGQDQQVAPGQPQAVRSIRVDNELFLDCGDVAKVLGWEFKIVQPDRLAVFCRNGENGFCIPVQLKPGNHRGAEPLLVAADVLATALSLRVHEMGGKITIARQPRSAARSVAESATGYNAEWGRGRGFQPGQTLPDIPLTNMEGREVRFSEFLGKRYIIYCWASW